MRLYFSARAFDNEGAEEFPDIVYPIEVLLEDSTLQTIDNLDELEELLDECYDNYFEDCFSINYPIQIQLPDGTVSTANNEDEIEGIIEAWYDANPNSMEDPTLVFPVDVTLEDGTSKTINNMDELDKLFEECYGDMGGCFVMDPQGTALTKSAIKKVDKGRK